MHRVSAFVAQNQRVPGQVAIGQHWGVENGLHGCLDVSMSEDQSCVRVKHGAENFSRLQRIALNKLKPFEIKKKNGKVLTAAIALKQQACGWSRAFLIQAYLHEMRWP